MENRASGGLIPFKIAQDGICEKKMRISLNQLSITNRKKVGKKEAGRTVLPPSADREK